MIDIPSGFSTSSSSVSTPSANTPAAAVAAPDLDSAKAAVQTKLDAVVQVVQARNPEGQADSRSWDVLLRLNPQASGPPLQTSELTPEIMRVLQSGQAVLLQTRSSQPLPVDARLQVNVSVAQGVQILQVQTPPLPQQLAAQLKQFIPQQQPLAPLLSNLLQLMQEDRQGQLARLPLRTQVAIANVIAALPDPAIAPAQLKTLIENSGLWQEAKLAQALKSSTPAKPDSAASQPVDAADKSTAQTRLQSTLLQVRQQLQSWMQQRVSEATGKTVVGKEAGSVQTTASTAVSTTALTSALEADLKQLLQRLERQLLEAGATLKPTKTTATDSTSTTTYSQAASAGAAAATARVAVTAPPPPPAVSPLPPAPPTGATLTAPVGADSMPPVPQQVPPAPAATPATNVAITTDAEVQAKGEAVPLKASHSPPPVSTETPSTRPSLSIQHYQASASANTRPRIATDFAATGLVPPLPGQVLVQAQPRVHASLKDDDMADAIVKTLLSQVRGALARVTLHQLSSHSARQDSAAPTSLSFEIPFLHHGQADVFQFRIDEETPSAEERRDKGQQKRWMVQLGFDIEGLGPMFCQISLTGKSMAVQFWAAWEQTLESTKAHFSFLEKSLQEMGINVEKIQARLGMPEVDHTGVRNQLVDIKT